MSHASVVEPMRAANLISGKTLYQVSYVAAPGEGGGPIASSGAVQVGAAVEIGVMQPPDILFVIAGGAPMAYDNAAVWAALRRLSSLGVTLGGVSGGPVILARAGVMAGRRMTVHWEHAYSLEGLEGDWLLERSLYVMDRDRLTCAGGIAPLDMMHALIASHHGSTLAQEVSDWFMHTEVRPAGGPQRGGLIERLGTHSRPVLEAAAAMENHVADPLTLPQLAQIAGVTPRQLTRLFTQKLGQSPMQTYRDMRLDVAQRLIAQTPTRLTQIALATGFANSAHFSRAFSARFGHAPSRARLGTDQDRA